MEWMDVDPTTTTIVWWRDPLLNADVRKTDTAFGGPAQQGLPTAISRSHHRICDSNQNQILDALTAHLSSLFNPIPTIRRHDDPDVPLGSETKLRIAGHRIAVVDLHTTYGLDIVGGVSAQLRGRGCHAVIAIDQNLNFPVRAAIMKVAHTELATFTDLPPETLSARGWQFNGVDRSGTPHHPTLMTPFCPTRNGD